MRYGTNNITHALTRVSIATTTLKPLPDAPVLGVRAGFVQFPCAMRRPRHLVLIAGNSSFLVSCSSLSFSDLCDMRRQNQDMRAISSNASSTCTRWQATAPTRCERVLRFLPISPRNRIEALVFWSKMFSIVKFAHSCRSETNSFSTSHVECSAHELQDRNGPVREKPNFNYVITLIRNPNNPNTQNQTASPIRPSRGSRRG